MKKIKEFWLKSNLWYDTVREPARFLIFFIPFATIILLGTINPMFYIILIVAFPRIMYTMSRGL